VVLPSDLRRCQSSNGGQRCQRVPQSVRCVTLLAPLRRATCVFAVRPLVAVSHPRSPAPSVPAVDEQGQLYAWGRNDSGQLGLGDSTTRAVPTKVEGLTESIRHASCGRRLVQLAPFARIVSSPPLFICVVGPRLV
jgi:hypothetical protein